MTAPPLLKVEGLSVHVGAKALLRDVSFELHHGEVLTLLGESGAGKSLLAQAVMGNLPGVLRADGHVVLDGQRSPADEGAQRRPRWGSLITLLPQEPSQALDPLMRLAPQVAEVHELVRGVSPDAVGGVALREIESAGLTHAARLYPWQLSGGMAQRAAMMVARAGGARILLADEPTKGLDATWRDHTVALLQAVQRDGGCVVAITHDLRVARALGGRLMVLRAGEVVEQGHCAAVLADPQHGFTRELLAAEPTRWTRRRTPAPGALVVECRGLSKRFGTRQLFDGLDLQIHAGERLVVQGSSGIGKSTLGNMLLGLSPADAGEVKRAPGLASTALQKLYQDPVASFSPHLTLERALRDVSTRYGCPWNVMVQRLEKLQVSGDLLSRRPNAVSGGELQRIALVRALSTRPALLFADEPTSRLDALSQRDAMALLLEVAEENNLALLLTTHDDDIAHVVGTRFMPLDTLSGVVQKGAIQGNTFSGRTAR